MKITEILKKPIIKHIMIIILTIIIIADFILNICNLIIIIKTRDEFDYLERDINSIEYNIDDMQDNISEIQNDIYYIKRDVSDIEYYLQ